jgi:membrane associated rhomboid family serine protease
MAADLEALEQDTEPESSDGLGMVERLVAGPGISLLAMALVSLATWTAYQAGNPDPFVLQAPITEDWWQLPLSVFAHQNMPHLVANATVIAAAGSLVVLFSGVVRYHLFFVTSGITAGAAQVFATGVLGQPGAVIGASGAGMALLGYVITSNGISSWILDRVPAWGVAVIVTGVALAITLRYSGVRVANVAHLAGIVFGLVTGHFNLLQTR